MKCRIAPLVAALLSLCGISPVSAQGTAFTYQGRLTVNGAPAHGLYSFQFLLRQTSNDAQQGPTLTTNGVAVSNGLFTATLNFGDYFGTREFALEIGVRTNGSAAPFTILSPRQIITPTPLAIAANHAAVATMADSVSAAGLPSSVPQLDANAQMRVNGSVVVGPDPFYAQGFEGVSFPPGNWSTGGSANWTRTTSTSSEGGASAVSAAIGNTQLSYLDFTYIFPVPMLVKFNWKVSSELSDFLRFCVDDNCDPVGANAISGEVDWTPVTVLVSAGVHTLRWVYQKDETQTQGSNRGWIDNVRLLTAEGNLQVNGNVTVTGNQTIAGTVGIGTVNPQSTVHVYSKSNPTTVRIQSSGAPGFGRVEFVSNPQGDVNEWRPGYIQSLDAGGFTGGLGFYLNGSGAGSKFGNVEGMRLFASGLYVNNTVYGSAAGNGLQGNSSGVSSSGVYGENTGQGYGVAGRSSGSGIAVYGDNANAAGWAGYFNGNVRVTGTINPPSDRHVKRNFETVNARAVLDKVAALSIQTWAYTNDANGSRHLGPVAQDFKAAFDLGSDDKSIATVDADGVALAAIQGLNQKLTEELTQRDVENAEMKKQNRLLEKRLERLEKLLPTN
jgi:hypothetical protein